MKPWERNWESAPSGGTEPWKRNWDAPAKVEPPKPLSALDGMSGYDKFMAGAGKGMTDLVRGIGQRFGAVSEQDVAEARKRDEPLMDSGAGIAGNITGSVAALAPALFIPGANTIAGATVLGGAAGAAQPTVEGESVAGNVATGAALGGLSQWGLGKFAETLGTRLNAIKEEALAKAARNSARDTAIKEAKEAGYTTVPSISGGNIVGRALEGLTGKEKAAQLAAVKNQPVTDSIVRKTMELSDDVPLSKETMRTVRAQAIEKGYNPVREVPFLELDDAFRKEISGLTSRSANAAKDFGDVVKSDVQPLADGLMNMKGFSGDSAVDAISVFREKASDLYASGNKSLGAAYRKAAEAIENRIERALPDGSDVLKNYRAARTRIAQSFDLEKAIREGDGVVDARVLGRMFEKAPDRLSDGLLTVGRTASAMKDVMGVPKAGWANPVTAVDSGVGTYGSILAGNPAPMAMPVARAISRYGLMSGPGQKMFATPRYGPGPIDSNMPMLLQALRQRGMGAMTGSGDPFQE